MSRVHPTPRSLIFNNQLISSCNNSTISTKKLRRLPHIFAKVLELPFRSNADVSIQETPNSFVFTCVTDSMIASDDIGAETIEIYPGVTKIVIRIGGLIGAEFELDLWRFRLPDCTVPELANAEYLDGELIVIVPKDANFDDDHESDGVGNQGNGRVVLVQVLFCRWSVLVAATLPAIRKLLLTRETVWDHVCLQSSPSQGTKQDVREIKYMH